MQSSNTTPPLTVEEGVSDFLLELGLRELFEQAVEEIRQRVPGLLRLHARLEYDHTANCPSILIEAVLEDLDGVCVQTEAWWLDWKTNHLTHDTFFNLSLDLVQE